MLNGTGYLRPNVDRYWQGNRTAWLWDNLFAREGFGEAPEKIRASLSAEFFATKVRIQAHPRSFYLKCLQFIHHNPLDLSVYYRGLLFERLWHIIFGEKPFLDGATIAECDLYKCEHQAQSKDRRLLLK